MRDSKDMMSFDDIMSVVHNTELMFINSQPVGIVMDKTERGPNRFLIVRDIHNIPTNTTLEYMVTTDKNVVAKTMLGASLYARWRNQNLLDHSQNDEIVPECPGYGSAHSEHTRWTRVKQVGTTFDRNGRSVDYEAEVPVLHCSHPDCNTYYVDHVGAAAIDMAAKEAREISESKGKLKSS